MSCTAAGRTAGLFMSASAESWCASINLRRSMPGMSIRAYRSIFPAQAEVRDRRQRHARQRPGHIHEACEKRIIDVIVGVFFLGRGMALFLALFPDLRSH